MLPVLRHYKYEIIHFDWALRFSLLKKNNIPIINDTLVQTT